MVDLDARANITQAMAGDVLGCSQATVSRRWDLLCPVIGHVLASSVPDPPQGIAERQKRPSTPSR